MQTASALLWSVKRNHEGDYHCTEQELKMMLRDANEAGNDRMFLEYYTMDDIDIPTLDRYRIMFRLSNPEHVWNDLDNKDFLMQLGGYVVNRKDGTKDGTKNDPKDGTKNGTKNDPKDDPKKLTDRQRLILEVLAADASLSAKAISERISEKTSVSDRTIEKDIAHLKEIGILSREGGRKEGKWIIKTSE